MHKTVKLQLLAAVYLFKINTLFKLNDTGKAKTVSYLQQRCSDSAAQQTADRFAVSNVFEKQMQKSCNSFKLDSVYLGEGTEPSSSSNRLSTVGRDSSGLVPFLFGFS